MRYDIVKTLVQIVVVVHLLDVTGKTFPKIGAFFCKGLPACMHIGPDQTLELYDNHVSIKFKRLVEHEIR